MTAPAQLALDLAFRPALEREDFLVGVANRPAVAWIDLWPVWPAAGLVVYGPAGSGKTHLAEVWRARSRAPRFEARALDSRVAAELPAISPSVAIEDIDRLAGQPAAARALLHVYNLVVERKGHVLLTARAAPAHLDLPLADLRSRLNALPAVAIGPPDDSLIEAVLVKHFADRRLQVAPDVVAYLVPRLERSFDAVRRAAAALDTASLARRRAVTIALVREVLREEPSPN